MTTLDTVSCLYDLAFKCNLSFRLHLKGVVASQPLVVETLDKILHFTCKYF